MKHLGSCLPYGHSVSKVRSNILHCIYYTMYKRYMMYVCYVYTTSVSTPGKLKSLLDCGGNRTRNLWSMTYLVPQLVEHWTSKPPRFSGKSLRTPANSLYFSSVQFSSGPNSLNVIVFNTYLVTCSLDCLLYFWPPISRMY
jgi:hypothetical protein